MRNLFILLAIIITTGAAASAQTGGQFCVRAFEDRNGNSQQDGGEPFLTRGVSANLLDADGVVVASALLDDSPTAAQGVICFQFLSPGQYTLEITSPDYTPTTPVSFTASISAGTLPTLVEFGGQRVVDAPPAGIETTDNGLLLDAADLPRIVLSGLGALVVMAGMVVMGAFIYLLAFRSSRPARPYYAAPPRTGDMSPVVNLDEIPDLPRTPTPGSVPIVDESGITSTDEDTSEIRPQA